MLHRGPSLSTLFVFVNAFISWSYVQSNSNATSSNSHEYKNVYITTADLNVTLINPEIESTLSASKIYQYESTISDFFKNLFGEHGEASTLKIEAILVQIAVKDQEQLALVPNNETVTTAPMPKEFKMTSEALAQNATVPKALLLLSSIVFVYARERELITMPNLLTSLLARKKDDLVTVLKEEGIFGDVEPSTILINHDEYNDGDEGYVLVEPVDHEIEVTNQVTIEVEPSEPVLKSGVSSATDPIMNTLGTNEDRLLYYCVYILAAMVALLSISLMYVTCKHRREKKKMRGTNNNTHVLPDVKTPTKQQLNHDVINSPEQPNLGACPRIDDSEMTDAHITSTPHKDIYKMAMNGNISMTPMSITTITPPRSVMKSPVPLGIHALGEMLRLTPPQYRDTGGYRNQRLALT